MLERKEKCFVLVKERMKQKSSTRNPTVFESERKIFRKFHQLSTHHTKYKIFKEFNSVALSHMYEWEINECDLHTI